MKCFPLFPLFTLFALLIAPAQADITDGTISSTQQAINDAYNPDRERDCENSCDNG